MALQYVGGQASSRAGATTTPSVSFALTGGLAAAPADGDFILITCVTGTAARNPPQAVSGYTAIGQLLADGTTYDTALNVSWKFASSDTAFTLPSTGNNADAQSYTVQVFRGVDPTTPFDVTPVSATGTGTSRPNPGAITPTTAGALVVVCSGGAAATTSALTYAALTNVLSPTPTADTNDSVVGSGYTTWTSGALDPAVSSTGSANAADSWAAYTIALRPAPPTPLVDTLTENFDGTLDSAKWGQTQSAGSNTQSLTGGKLRQTLGHVAVGEEAVTHALVKHNLTGSSIYVKVATAMTLSSLQDGIEQQFYLQCGPLADADQVGWYVMGTGGLHANWRNGNSYNIVFSDTYSATTHKWLRIRESGGTVYWDTAPASASNPPASGDWVNRASLALSSMTGVTVDSVYPALALKYWQTTSAAPTMAEWDGLNTAATAAVTHDTSGALAASGAALAGTAARSGGAVEHATSGALAASGAALAGSAARTRVHAASGALAGPGAALAGAAARSHLHEASGALAASGAALAGTAARSLTTSEHTTSGALTGPGSSLAGVAARSRLHATSGALTGPGSALAGTAARSPAPVVHTTSGALVGPASNLLGTAARGADATKLSSIQDEFDAASINAAKWNTYVLGAAVGTISQTGGKLRLNLTSGVTGNQLLVESVAIKSLVGSEVYTKLSGALVVTNNTLGAEARLSLGADGADSGLGWHQQSNGTIEPQWRVAGVSDSGGAVSYTPATHAWLRIRENGGTVYWDSAPSSASDPPLSTQWVNRFSKPLSELFAVTAMRISFAVSYWGGTPGTPAGPVEFDCVNTRTRAAVSHDTSGALAGPGTALAGAAARRITHVASGALLAQASRLLGQGRREKAHHCAGALVGGSAIIAGISSTSDSTREQWVVAQDTGGAWADQSTQDSDPWTPAADTGGAWES